MPNNHTFSCSDVFNATGRTYDVEKADGGIPENLLINFLVWLVIVLAFCVMRRWAWDYGRIALVQADNRSWAKIFFGKAPESNTNKINEEDSMESHVSDKGYFGWIVTVFKLSGDDICNRAGDDAVHYLEFQKCLIWYTAIICALSNIVILPVNYSGNNIPDKKHYGRTTIANLAPDSNVIWLHTIFSFLYFAILLLMLWKFSRYLESDSDPLSQLTVLVTHVSRTATDEQIRKHFDEVYGEGSVSHVQFAYDINALTVINRRLTSASLGKHKYAVFVMKYGKRLETSVSTSHVCPCCPCYKVKCDGLEYFSEREERYKDDFTREKETVLKEKAIKIMFVTFTKPSVVLRCIQDYSLILGGTYTPTSMSSDVRSFEWSVERAPSPGNVIWENLSSDPKYWWIRALLINFCLFMFALFFTTPAIVLAGWNQLQSSVDSKVKSEGSSFTSQFLPTLLLWIFTAILPSIVSWSSYYEHHWTRTRLEKSLMFKVYIFLLFMIVILPSLALTSVDALFELTFRDFESIQERMGCVFLPNSGAFFVNYIITSAFIGTALELIRVPELVVYGARMLYTKNEGERLLVKREAVVEFPFGIRYAWMIAIYSIIIIYSIACPLIVPFGLLYLVLKHFVDRYNLYFNYRPPAHKYMDRSVHKSALYFLIVSTYMLLLCILFYCIIRLGIDDPQTVFALAIFLFVLIIFIGKMCFGWFSRFTIYQRRSPSFDALEVPTDPETSEAYLPPVLQSSYRVGGLSEDDPGSNLRRRHYGLNDHVIDSSKFSRNDDVIVDVPGEASNTEQSEG